MPEPSKKSLERARLIVEKYFDGPLEDHCRWGHELWVLVALEFDAIAANAKEKESCRLAVETNRIVQTRLAELRQQNAALMSALQTIRDIAAAAFTSCMRAEAEAKEKP